MDAKQARIMYEEKKLNLTTGYVLWFFWFHYIHIKQYGMFVLMLISYIFLVGWIRWIIQLFFVKSNIERYNARLREIYLDE